MISLRKVFKDEMNETVMSGIDNQAPITITVGSAVAKSPRKLLLPHGSPNARKVPFIGPEFGFSKISQIIATTTGDNAHGNIERNFKSPEYLFFLSMRSARTNPISIASTVTDTAQIVPMRKDFKKSGLASASR